MKNVNEIKVKRNLKKVDFLIFWILEMIFKQIICKPFIRYCWKRPISMKNDKKY